MKTLIPMFWALAAAFLAAYLCLVMGEVVYVTLADGRKAERRIPLAFKILLPLCPNFFRFINPEYAARFEPKLAQAGMDGLISGREFVALKAMLLWVFPDIWLREAIKLRHTSIMRSLPFVLDLLTLSVEAGMDFVSALQRNCSAKKLNPLNEELLVMTREIQIGSSRKEALRHMSERVGEPNLRAFAFALIQADELGVSIGTMLRIQAEQMRDKRFDRAERLAAQAPTKMLFPLMLCIFPAVFIILLGPVLANALKGMF